jgi:hypothetical protein
VDTKSSERRPSEPIRLQVTGSDNTHEHSAFHQYRSYPTLRSQIYHVW